MKKLFLLLLLFSSLIYSQTSCISEGFSSGITPPTGWTFTGITGTYTTTGNFGLTSPSIRFDTSLDMVSTPNVTNPTQLSFWIKGQGTNTTSPSSLLVEGFNGTTWVTIDNITPIPTIGTTKIYNSTSLPALPINLQKFRFTYTKSAGNLSFDDVNVLCTSCTPPTISSISPTSGTIGTQVTITASSGSLLNATAKISGINATILSSSTTQLVILIPSGATSGAISITDTQPCSTTTSTFTINIPTPQCGYLTDLFMSQVTDASSGSLSYIEIYNGTGSPVNLGNYSIKTANNGGVYGNSIILNNILLNNNSTYVIAVGTSATNCSVSGGDGTKSSQSSPNGSIDFGNGSSDHFGLFNGTTLIDSFGTFGSNSWANALIGTKAGDFKRKNNVILPSTSFNITDWTITDWIDTPICSNDEYSDVGLYTFIPPTSTTWNGTSWSNGTPTISKLAIINGNYNTTTNGDIEVCSLIVNPNFLLEITDSRYVKIQNDLTVSGTLNVLNNGSLVQVNDSGVNSGNITYNRTVTGLRGYDYIYWASPTTSSPLQTLSSLYTTPTPGFQYQWNPTVANTNSTFGNWQSASSMTSGRGYIMRTSSSYGLTGVTLTSQFVGIPNNGVITCPLEGITLLSTESYSNLASFPTLGTFNRLYRATDTGLEYYWNGSTYIISTSLDSSFTNNRWNLIGNPYPSSIRALSFLTSNNNIDGFVNIWTHGTAPISTTSPYYQSFQYNYTSNDYITYNATGLSSGPTGFNGYIASGQGFLVNLLQANTPTSNLVFNNSMRSETYSNSQFYRTSENNNEGRIWLDLLNTNNIPTRLLVGYKEDATIERDRLYDAITTQDFYTTINNDKFIIQGRPDFNEDDQVILGINITTPGEYKIAIAETDGILTTQNIYLQDLYSNTIHDIRQSPYVFTTNSGTFNDRFILRYTNNSLGNNDFVINNTIIYNKDNKINIDSNKIIKNVKVYDITGKLLYDNNFNSNNVKISLECSKQILFVKIKTEDDQVTTRKILND